LQLALQFRSLKAAKHAFLCGSSCKTEVLQLPQICGIFHFFWQKLPGFFMKNAGPEK